MRLLAARPPGAVAARAPLGVSSALPRLHVPLSAHRRRQLHVTATASPGGPQQEEEEQQPGERRPFPAAAAAVRRQEIQRQRAATWARIDSLVVYDSEEEDASLIDLVGDEFKEADRKNLRDVFDFERWAKHRSSSRYMRHARATFTSRITQGLAAPLLYVTTLSTGVAAWHAAAEAGYISPIADLKIDATFSLTSFALSLLLAYRTSASYGRWDEARKMWGLVVNRSRDLTRQGLGYIPDSQPELQAGLVRWVIAYSRSLMCHLRGGEDLGAELAGVLPKKELDALLASTHRPNYCVQVLAAILKESKLPGWTVDNLATTANVKASAFVRMDEQLTVFADVTGGCERILRTPIPLSYTRHTSRFLVIWLTLMPFTLWDQLGWAMIPISVVVGFLLLGIEEIGVSVEEPFSILPLETISRTIEGNVRELEKQHGAQGAAARRQLAVAGSGAGANGEIEADDLVAAIVPSAELDPTWGPEWVVTSGTGGPAAVPAAAR